MISVYQQREGVMAAKIDCLTCPKRPRKKRGHASRAQSATLSWGFALPTLSVTPHQKKARVRISMLSRAGASGGLVGSSKAL